MSDFYKDLLIALAVFAFLGGIYYAGGVTPRRELAQFKAQAVAAAEAIEAKQKADKEASDKLIAEKDHTYETDTAAIRAGWADWMRKHPGGSAASKPVPIAAGVCDSETSNAAVSAAVQEYVSAVGRFRADVAELLEQAELDGAALQCARTWAAGEQLIHH